MRPIKFCLLLLTIQTIFSADSNAQPNDEKKQDSYLKLKTLISSKQYRFHANSATTLKGKNIQLTSDYYLKVNNDSLMADLPYYGRSYSSAYPGTDQSVQFTSTDFSYAADTTKKGGWEITMKPKNETKASKIFLSITSGGYCTVRISSNTRQDIAYYGTIVDYDQR